MPSTLYNYGFNDMMLLTVLSKLINIPFHKFVVEKLEESSVFLLILF